MRADNWSSWSEGYGWLTNPEVMEWCLLKFWWWLSLTRRDSRQVVGHWPLLVSWNSKPKAKLVTIRNQPAAHWNYILSCSLSALSACLSLCTSQMLVEIKSSPFLPPAIAQIKGQTCSEIESVSQLTEISHKDTVPISLIPVASY